MSCVTDPAGLLAELRDVTRARVKSKGLCLPAERIGVPVGKIRGVMAGRDPHSTTIAALSSALGLECYVGPSRRRRRDYEPITPDFGEIPAPQLQALEGSAQGLVRVVAEAGGDPIPADIRESILALADAIEADAREGRMPSTEIGEPPEGLYIEAPASGATEELVPQEYGPVPRYDSEVRLAAGTGCRATSCGQMLAASWT